MSPEIQALLAGETTLSGKIRALDAAGYKRAEIARIVDRRYQHVRNVLEDASRKAARETSPSMGVAEATVSNFVHDHAAPYRLEVRKDGSVVLPPEVLRALGTRPGGVIIADLGDERFTMISAMVAIQRIQGHFKTLSPASDDRLLSEELIDDRRREAEDEGSGES